MTAAGFPANLRVVNASIWKIGERMGTSRYREYYRATHAVLGGDSRDDGPAVWGGRSDRVVTSLCSCLIHQREQFGGGVPVADGHILINGK